jgi:hypothetical protein
MLLLFYLPQAPGNSSDKLFFHFSELLDKVVRAERRGSDCCFFVV